MTKRTITAWLATVVAVYLGTLLARGPLVTWLAERDPTYKPPHPEQLAEREQLANWRNADLHDDPPMHTIPFRITSDSALGEMRGIAIENSSSRAIRNCWFYRQDMPNFHSASTIVESVTAAKKSETEKVVALWELFPRYYYNYFPLRCDGLLLDPPTLLAVLGTAQCNDAASVLATLCLMTGCPARLLGVELEEAAGNIAHCVMEVKADGRWIYMDPDGHAIYRRGDGDWASASDLIQSPEIARNSPHAYYNPSVLADAFAKGSVLRLNEEADAFHLAERQTNPAHYSAFRHVMRFDLLPGENVALRPDCRGRYYESELPLYCNGTMTWTYRPTDFAQGLCSGLIGENLAVRMTSGGVSLSPATRGQAAAMIIPITSPYLMVGGRLEAQIQSGEQVRFLLLRFLKVSVEELQGWDSLPPLSPAGKITFDDVFKNSPLFGYALKLEVPPSGLVIHSMEIQTWLQCAPKALPYLLSGENRFSLYCQDEATPLPQQPDIANAATARFDNGLKISFAPTGTGSVDSTDGASLVPVGSEQP